MSDDRVSHNPGPDAPEPVRPDAPGPTRPARPADLRAHPHWWLTPDRIVEPTSSGFIDHIAIPLVIGGPSAEILHANPAFCALVGRDEDDLRRVGYLGITHPDDVEREVAAFREAVEDGLDVVEFEKRYVRPDGTTVPVLLRCVLARDEQGRILGGFNTVTDLTLHQVAHDRTLRRHIEMFRRVFEESPIAMSLQDAEGRYVQVNKRLSDAFGISPEELIGRSGREFTHPDDREEADALLARVRSGDAPNYTIERRYVRRDGSVLRASLSVSALRDPAGKLEGVIVQWVDVTARHEAEERARLAYARMRHIAETLPMLLYVLDVRERRLVYVNRAIERIGGYTADEVMALRGEEFVSAIFHPEDVPLIVSEWARAESLPAGAIFETDFRARHRDGTWRWVHSHQSVFERDPDGSARTHVGVLEDITERRGLEERLRQSQKMDAIGRLAGGVAHDFNNLLTAVLGYADMALQHLPPHSPARADLDQVVLAGQRAAAVTRQLLAFARPQVLEQRVLDLDSVIRESGTLLRRIIGEDVRVVLECGGGLGTVRTDPGQVTQMLLNMAANAREAMPRGGTFRVVTADVPATEESPERRVRITVADDGHGMDAETLAHVFEPFFTTKPTGHGAGLGLAMVYGYVQGMRGSITVHSAPGAGTRFEILLPCVGGAVDIAAPAPAPGPTAGGRAPAHHTLLVVEDDSAVRTLMRTVLQRAGYRVLEAPDGHAALARLEDPTEAVDLVVSDIVMPGLGGPAMIEAARHRHPALRALFVTGYADDSVVSSIPPGTQCLRKPFSPEVLLQRVRELLEVPPGGMN